MRNVRCFSEISRKFLRNTETERNEKFLNISFSVMFYPGCVCPLAMCAGIIDKSEEIHYRTLEENRMYHEKWLTEGKGQKSQNIYNKSSNRSSQKFMML